jgi:hypothetical protein
VRVIVVNRGVIVIRRVGRAAQMLQCRLQVMIGRFHLLDGRFQMLDDVRLSDRPGALDPRAELGGVLCVVRNLSMSVTSTSSRCVS